MINKKIIDKLKELADIPHFTNSNEIIGYTDNLEMAYCKGAVDGAAILAKLILSDIEDD